MIRIDLQSAVVVSVAVAASLASAAWLNHMGGRGEAQAAPVMAAPVMAEAAVGTETSGQATQIMRDADGHYWSEAMIDGRAVRVLVDTGASVVALTREDALRLGVDPAPEAFTGRVQTASGVVRAAPVRLEAVSVAGARVDGVEALVVEQGLAYSLLGMSYLGRLSSFEATPSGLTLRP